MRLGSAPSKYGWPQLAEATQASRTAAGHSPNDPLLVKGELRDSITRKVVDSPNAYVGSNSTSQSTKSLARSGSHLARSCWVPRRVRRTEVQHLMGGKVHAKLTGG